ARGGDRACACAGGLRTPWAPGGRGHPDAPRSRSLQSARSGRNRRLGEGARRVGPYGGHAGCVARDDGCGDQAPGGPRAQRGGDRRARATMIGRAPDPVESVTLFARLLRDAGLTTGPERVRDACEALLAIDLSRPDEVRFALRAVFVTRREEGAVFDAAFDLFFSRPGGEGHAGSIPGRSRPLPIDPRHAKAWMNALDMQAPGVAREVEGPPASSTGYSAEELLRRRDFREMSWDELATVRRLL